MSVINQKEYLKKYLGIGKQPGEKKKKKKKEKKKPPVDRLKIIDDDLDVAISQEIQDDLTAENEDAPQVVAVIDERPLHLQIDERTKRKLWEPIGRTEGSAGWVRVGGKGEESPGKDRSGSENEAKRESPSPPRKTRKSSPPTSRPDDNPSPDPNWIKRERRSLSPSRTDRNLSPPPRKRTKSNYDSAAGKKPVLGDRKPREKKLSQPSTDLSPPKKPSSVDDLSPVRKRSRRSSTPRNQDSSLRRGDGDSKRVDVDDLSPLRIRIKKEKTTSPPPRNEDLSPPRRKDLSQPLEGCSPPTKRSSMDDFSPVRQRSRRSLSPRKRDSSHRKGNIDSKRPDIQDLSPIRRRIKKEDTTSPPPRDKDLSPPRKKDSSHSQSFEDLSPVRRHTKKEKTTPPSRNKDSSQSRSHDNLSHVRNEIKRGRNVGTGSSSREKNKYSERTKQKRSRWEDHSPEPERPKTLSGKRAGLQNARELVEEIEAAKKREDEVFRNLTAEQSGRHASTVVRNQKVVDPEEEARKLEKEREIKEKYDRWGKGLKQVEDNNQKLADELYEMTKPLARYADDEDLERYLKEQEREGDPMLDYIRKKRKKKVVEDGIPEKPTYMGEFMPNRFGIRPGHRWDGVDRSNGYEKKYFEVQNARRATQDEAFKWSTEDM